MSASNRTPKSGALSLPSYAKINLSLRVLGRRPADGYHEIRTVFQTVTLRDRLTFRGVPDGRLELACDAPEIPADDTNLIWRAAHALREHYGLESAGVRVTLEKRIPAGGGLGGGSSNAAVALMALAHLWNIEVEGGELAELGARLGADVPFFLMGGTALGTGTGAEVLPLSDAPEMELLIVSPGVAVSTTKAYAALQAPVLTTAASPVNLPISRKSADFTGPHHEGLLNDFERVVPRLYPEIGRAKRALLEAGARAALLSGSGSSVFGVFESSAQREQAEIALRAEADWKVFLCDTLTRAEYLKALGPAARIWEGV
ncbi:MAG: 4-(cytidine 5'-diphospho)-2-C-methyl-D-erythritol kinase [Pyrinomonadaceae bacterium]